MPKLPILTPKQLLQKLKRLGFTNDHQTGSHIIMYHTRTKKRAVIPYHLRTIPKGTLLSLLHEAGLTKDDISNC